MCPGSRSTALTQIGLGPFGVPQLVDAQLGGQVEQLAGLGVVLDPLGAGLVEGDQAVVLLRLTVGFPQRDERFGVCRIPLEGGFVFSDGGHAREPQNSAKRQGRRARGGAHPSTGAKPKPRGRKSAQPAE